MNKLLETTNLYPQTEIWNDSCSYEELDYCIKNGGVGATTNPVIVLSVVKNELVQWESTIQELIHDNPYYSEDQIAWDLIKIVGEKASKLLLNKYEESNGRQGRISFQTNAKYYNNARAMIEHGLDLAGTVENSQVKLPTSKAGIEAFEELTFQGVSINATVSFTVSQAIAVAEAVERGLKRRVEQGLPIDQMNPVCTIMVGRVDDYLKKVAEKQESAVDPEILEWAGVAVFKHAYEIYQSKGYRTTLLAAAYRNPYHWNQFVGGKVVLTIPYKWQLKFANYPWKIEKTIQHPVCQEKLEKLKLIPEFIQAYDEAGLSYEEFEHYGAFVATMNQFLSGYDELCQLIRKYMIQ